MNPLLEIDPRIPAAAAEGGPQNAAEGGPQNAAEGAGVRVSLIGDLSFAERIIAGRRTYVCHHHQKGQFFHFGTREYEAAMLLDGTREIAEVTRQLNRHGANWTPAEVARWIAMLVHSGLARVVDGPKSGAAGSLPGGPDPGSSTAPPAGSAPSDSVGVPRQLARWLSPLLSQRLNLVDGDCIASRLLGIWGPLFSPRGVAAWLAVVLSGLSIVAAHSEEFSVELGRLFSPHSWPLLVLIWCFAKVAHEAGHAVAAKRQGVRVGRAGIILFLFAPLAFVDVTDAWRLQRRWSRVQIALAGMYVELGIAGIAAWYWWWADGGMGRHIAAQVVMLAGPASLFINANPLLRLDGYYILADMLDIPNLRMHGRQRVLAKFESMLFARACPEGLLTGWRASVTTVHAVCSIVFQTVWMGGLVIAVSLWARGAGLVLALAASLLWGIIPLAWWVGRIRRDQDWGTARRRLAGLLAVGAGGIALLAVLPSPLSRRVPVVVQYDDEQIARAATDGFVTAVPVRTGERVQAGDVLVVMDDPELRVQKEQLALEAEAADLRARRLGREGKTALASAEKERHLGLLRSLEELQRQLESLRICARRDGVICSPRPERWVGRFAHRGDLLLRVGEETAKELLASIDGSDLEAYLKSAERRQPCEVRIRGGHRFVVVPESPQPRVRQTIPHPALAATAGGPLPVEPQRDLQAGHAFRLIAPRSESSSPLGPQVSQSLRAGQQGMLIIGDSRSLIDRAIAPLWQAMSRVD